jgi:hypothetical protein
MGVVSLLWRHLATTHCPPPPPRSNPICGTEDTKPSAKEYWVPPGLQEEAEPHRRWHPTPCPAHTREPRRPEGGKRRQSAVCRRSAALLRDLIIHERLCSSFERSSSRLCRQLRTCAKVLMLSKKQWFEPRRMGSLWFGGVRVFVCVELAAAAEWPRKRT